MGQWMRVAEAVGTLAQMAERFLPKPPAAPGEVPPSGAGGLEARLAGVVVAALKEAFDRDRVRMDLEREQIELERRRAELALQAELRRQAVERASGQLRLIAIMALAVWMLSAPLAVWLVGMRSGVPRGLLSAGWALALTALGCAFAGWRRTAEWTGAGGGDLPSGGAAAAAPWLLLVALALIGASLIVAL